MDHRTITRKNNAGHLILSALLLCQPLILSAINPQREYSVPIEERGKNFEELQVETTDGFKINVWHLPSENGTPLIISESDAGNMGDCVHLGRFLQLYGIDVWLYDYRGFGASSDSPSNGTSCSTRNLSRTCQRSRTMYIIELERFPTLWEYQWAR